MNTTTKTTTPHDENGRVCVRCKEYKIWKEYYKTIKLRIVCKTEVNQHSSSCKECHRKDMKELSAKNRRENPNIKPRYNIGLDKKGRNCSVCHEYKTWENFHKNSSHSTGYISCCKDCKKKQYAEHYAVPEDQKKPRFKWTVTNKGRTCTQCGEMKLFKYYTKSNNSIWYASICNQCKWIRYKTNHSKTYGF